MSEPHPLALPWPPRPGSWWCAVRTQLRIRIGWNVAEICGDLQTVVFEIKSARITATSLAQHASSTHPARSRNCCRSYQWVFALLVQVRLLPQLIPHDAFEWNVLAPASTRQEPLGPCNSAENPGCGRRERRTNKGRQITMGVWARYSFRNTGPHDVSQHYASNLFDVQSAHSAAQDCITTNKCNHTNQQKRYQSGNHMHAHARTRKHAREQKATRNNAKQTQLYWGPHGHTYTHTHGRART